MAIAGSLAVRACSPLSVPPALRLMILALLSLLLSTKSKIMTENPEITTEPEITEITTDREMTENPEITTEPEVTENPEVAGQRAKITTRRRAGRPVPRIDGRGR
jgi:hypothetical protein